MRFVLFMLLAACGGGAKTAKSPEASGVTAAKSECAVVAAHVADAVFTWKEPPPTSKENVAQVITERCEGDQWTADAIACFGKITDEDSTKPCIDTLTKDQHEKVMNAMESKFDHKTHHQDDAEGAMGGTRGIKPAGSPPPAPPPGGPAKGADPCEGGE